MARARRGRNEGSIFQRADNRWVARLTIGYDETGKRRTRTAYGRTKKEAQSKLVEMQHAKAHGTLIESDRVTVADYLKAWMAHSGKERLSASTWERYSTLIKLHINPSIGGIRLQSLNAAHVRTMHGDLIQKELAGATRSFVHAILRRALNCAEKDDLITRNPCRAVEPPKIDSPEITPLDAEQARALLLAASGNPYEAVFVLAITTGMRQGELFGLNWRDVDLQAGRLSVRYSLEELKGKHRLKPPKTKAGLRNIELPAMAVEALHARRALMMADGLAGCDLVFCDSKGGFIRRQNFARRVWKPLREAAGIPAIRFHDLRHSSATLLLLQGEHPKVVSERMGHSRISVTLDTYSHCLPSMQREAAARLDRLFKPETA